MEDLQQAIAAAEDIGDRTAEDALTELRENLWPLFSRGGRKALKPKLRGFTKASKQLSEALQQVRHDYNETGSTDLSALDLPGRQWHRTASALYTTMAAAVGDPVMRQMADAYAAATVYGRMWHAAVEQAVAALEPGEELPEALSFDLEAWEAEQGLQIMA